MNTQKREVLKNVAESLGQSGWAETISYAKSDRELYLFAELICCICMIYGSGQQLLQDDWFFKYQQSLKLDMNS